MKTRSVFKALLIGALLWLPAARADTPVAVQNEVNFLFGYIAGSGCEFYRNVTLRRHTDSSLGAQADVRLSVGVFQRGPFSAGLAYQWR